jgi:cytochrome b561
MNTDETFQSSDSHAQSYTRTAVAMHWLLGMALVGMFAVGYYMEDLPLSPAKLQLFNWHKWAGICLLTLSVLRLLWRITHRPPPLPADIQNDMPAWQHHAHYLTQYSMYGLFFLVPLVGWAYSSAAGFPVVVFGVLPLPDFVPANEALAELLKAWHEGTAMALAILILLHVAAAIKHQWVDKHALLQRMWPRR